MDARSEKAVQEVVAARTAKEQMRNERMREAETPKGRTYLTLDWDCGRPGPMWPGGRVSVSINDVSMTLKQTGTDGSQETRILSFMFLAMPEAALESIMSQQCSSGLTLKYFTGPFPVGRDLNGGSRRFT